MPRVSVLMPVDGTTPSAEIAPWWPFTPGPLPALPQAPSFVELDIPDRPDAVLDTLEALDVEIGARSLVELVRPLYQQIVDPRGP